MIHWDNGLAGMKDRFSKRKYFWRFQMLFRKKIIIGFMLVFISLGSLVAWAAVDSKIINRYGLNRIPEPYNGRIRQLIGLNALQYKAIVSSGFKIYILEDIFTIKKQLKKIYKWRDWDGNIVLTEHLLGLNERFMQTGDAYIGKSDIAFLTIYIQNQKETFSIQRF